jgi:hypothetical protein
MPIFVMFFMNIFFYWDSLSQVNPLLFFKQGMFCLGMFCTGIFLSLIFIIGKYKGKKNSGKSYTRVILTEIFHLLGMKSFRDDLIDRMKTGWGCFVLASHHTALRQILLAEKAVAKTFLS